MPPIIIWVMRRLPSVVGWLASHLLRFAAIFSIVGVHGVAWSTLLPIHAPRTQTGCPSGVILMFVCRGSLSGFSFRVDNRAALYSFEPIGMISVFAVLNTAPDTSPIAAAQKIY